jgi:phage gp36-like protein
MATAHRQRNLAMHNADFLRQRQEHEEQMFEHEQRIQRFKESVTEIMEQEGRDNRALSQALQDAMREIDLAVNKLNGSI